MALYQLTLFYPKLREFAGTVAQIRKEVEGMAGTNWRLLSAGEQVCGIAFESDVPPADIQARLSSFGGKEQFHFLLVEIAKVHGGYLTTGVWQWLARHRGA